MSHISNLQKHDSTYKTYYDIKSRTLVHIEEVTIIRHFTNLDVGLENHLLLKK